MFPIGHSSNTTCDLKSLLDNKWSVFGSYALKDPAAYISKLNSIDSLETVQGIYDCDILNDIDS